MTEKPHYDIELTRVFDAPRERVYQAFTDSDEFAQWYGPVGFPARRDTVELDARVGSSPTSCSRAVGAGTGSPVRRTPGRRTCGWSSMTRTA